jgi:hypothetical protein
MEAVDVDGAAEVVEEPPQASAAYFAPRSTSIPTINTSAPAVDKTDEIKMWAVSILDAKKKKKKGTLGIGNGSLFFASDSDKTPVQKIPVLKITTYTIENKGKQLRVELDPSAGVEGDLMTFACEKKEGDELISKLDESRGKAERVAAAEMQNQEAPEEEQEQQQAYGPPIAPPAPTAPRPPVAAAAPILPPPQRTNSSTLLPPPQRRTGTSPSASTASTPLRETPPAPTTNGHSRGEPCVALYDFEAQGDDELGVGENESLTLLERENDDWWKVRNAQGQEGVVPASYIEVAEGAAAGQAEQAAPQDAETDVEAARQREEAEREQLLAAEQRRKEARDRLAREAEERRRREALKAQPAPTPPTVARSTVAADGARAAAKDVKIPEGRSAPARPKEAGSKAKPAPSKTRVWHDRSGQFRVEAEFLGFNQGKLRLHKLNGVVIEVAIEKMSKPDIQYLEEVTGKPLLPRRDKAAAESSRGAASGGASDPRQSERERERRKEKEREARRRQAAARGPRRNIDWFEFFLAAGVDVHDCTRYATAFEKDNIDDTILPDMEPTTLRSLGLREGDNIRVMKFIERKYKPQRSTSGMTQADIAKQMKADEELAKKLQEQERGAKGSGSESPGLFSGPDGTLKNNTRRGRPTPKASTSGVDAASIAAAGESLGRTASPAQRSSTSSPNIDRGSSQTKASASTKASGFDDDAWTPRPNSAKPASPPPPAKAATPTLPPPAPKAPTPPPAPAPVEPAKPADPNSALFDKLAAMKPPSAAEQQRPGASPGSSFLTAGGYNPNGARGPMAPVPQNQGLLQPLISTQGTGQFVPTRNGMMGQQATGMMGQQPTGMMGQQPTGWGGMQQQPTGFYGSSGGYQQQQPQQPGFGGMASQPTGWMGSQQTAMSTNISGFASPQPQSSPAFQSQQQQQPQQTGISAQQTGMGQNGGAAGAGDKYGAGNIFAQMKSGQFGKDANNAAQPPAKYDALRPQPTGWSPAGVQQPQQTGAFGGGMYPQQTGVGMGMMQPQYTAMQQQPQHQQGGMMYGQPTGFNGQGQYGQQGYGYQQQY